LKWFFKINFIVYLKSESVYSSYWKPVSARRRLSSIGVYTGTVGLIIIIILTINPFDKIPENAFKNKQINLTDIDFAFNLKGRRTLHKVGNKAFYNLKRWLVNWSRKWCISIQNDANVFPSILTFKLMPKNAYLFCYSKLFWKRPQNPRIQNEHFWKVLSILINN
jgi:hypothetical protein